MKLKIQLLFYICESDSSRLIIEFIH